MSKVALKKIVEKDLNNQLTGIRLEMVKGIKR